MKIIVINILVILLLPANALLAQAIHYQVFTRNSDCNGADNGRAEIIVDQVNPPYTFLWNLGNANNSISGLGVGEYSVTVTDSIGNDTIIHVTISEIECKIAPVLVFTPNGDGIKDTWSIQNIEHYPDNLILVYNRWGQKVYEHRGAYEPWDGKDILGVPLPDNSYYYIIYADRKDEGSIIKGTVSILR